MSSMNAGIILAGRQPDFANALAQSDLAAARKQQFDRQNALADVMQQHGPAILAGDQNALAEYARHDVGGAQAIMNRRDANARADQQLRMQVERYAQGISAQQAAQEVEEARRTALLLSNTQTPEEYDALAQRVAPNLVGTFANKDMNVQMIMTSAELMEQAKPAKPQSAPGKVQADINAGILPEGTPLRNTTPLVSFGGGDTGAAPLPGPPTQNVEAGSARNAFGATGLVGNAVNAVTDFAVGKEVFPELGENVRFFRNLQEDLLVGLSQAYGRQPAQALMERLRGLLPNVTTTEGSQAAFRELVEMRNRFERDLGVARVNAQRARTANNQQEFSGRVLGLESAIQQIDEGIRRLAPPEETSTGGPEVGAIEDNYRFKGGDPGDPNNWELAQ